MRVWQRYTQKMSYKKNIVRKSLPAFVLQFSRNGERTNLPNVVFYWRGATCAILDSLPQAASYVHYAVYTSSNLTFFYGVSQIKYLPIVTAP